MRICQITVATLLAASGLAFGERPLAGQGGANCAAQPSCAEVTTFIATLSDFRESTSGTYRLVTATVRFQNKTDGPLVLGYVSGSGVAVDDRGNRYVVRPGKDVRGIGQVTTSTFDPKFVLQPGEVSNARFEFVWQPSRSAIYGTTYEFDVAIREIDPVTASQYRLGKEHALHFSGFGDEPASAAEGSRGPTSETAGAALPEADPCGGEVTCNHAGPFVAEVLRVNHSTSGPYQVVEATVRFTNLTTGTLILGYTANSSVVIDDVGNRYRATTNQNVSGMGTVSNRGADPSFRLKSGQSRNATFRVWLQAGRKQVGTRYALDLTVEQLEVLPSRQIRSVREYAVGFRDLTTGSGGSGSNLLGEILKQIVKPTK